MRKGLKYLFYLLYYIFLAILFIIFNRSLSLAFGILVEVSRNPHFHSSQTVNNNHLWSNGKGSEQGKESFEADECFFESVSERSEEEWGKC